MKNWSYQEITTITERRLNTYLSLTKNKDGTLITPPLRNHFKTMARGAYQLWETITGECKTEGDTQRLKALINKFDIQ